MEKVKKTRSKKWIMAIALIIIIIVAAGFYFNIFSISTGLVAGTDEATSESASEAEETKEAPKFTVTGNEIIAKEVTESLPYYESVDLEPGRYALQVLTDEPVWIMLYDQRHFEDWQTGYYGTKVAGTGCCRAESKTNYINREFDISKKDGGRYYLVIEGPKTLEGPEEFSIKFKINQKIKF